jgi:flagellar hook protein FlgE
LKNGSCSKGSKMDNKGVGKMINGIYSAISALKVFEKKLGTAANNMANVNTQGFKASRASSQEVSTQDVSASSGTAQVGRGTTLGTVSEDFAQGSFESTSSTTDMAIGGDGFFIAEAPEGRTYYTRDGQFNFDKDGTFVTTAGHAIQGWQIDPNTGEAQGAIQDITLGSFTSPPEETTVVKNIINLNANSEDKSVGANALANAWDGDNPAGEYMANNAYEYQTSTKVYDSVGAAHDITSYFDKTGTDSVWEFIVTANPAEDLRPGATGDNLGLLARGTLTFNDSGAVSDMTMDINDGAGNWTSQNVATDLKNGHFTFNPDFLGATDGSTEMSIRLDFGSFYNGSSWVNDASSSTQYSASSKTVYSSADGYGSGDLEAVAVSTDGVITGSYSNGQVMDLYQVAIAKFNNPQELKKIGNNLYAQTNESGDAITGQPGTNGLGSIAPNALEQSNVDIGKEFVNIILIKTGFQANLKIISAEDEMIGDLLNIIS